MLDHDKDDEEKNGEGRILYIVSKELLTERKVMLAVCRISHFPKSINILIWN